MDDNTFKRYVINALSAINYADPKLRVKVYLASTNAIRKLNAEKNASYDRNHFLTILAELENTISANLSSKIISNIISDNTVEFKIIDKIAAQIAPTDNSSNAIDQSTSPIVNNIRAITPEVSDLDPLPKPQSNKKFFNRKLLLTITTAFVLATVPYAAISLYQSLRTDESNLNKSVLYDSNILFEADFFGDLSQFDDATQAFKPKIKTNHNIKEAVVTGRAVFTGKEAIPVSINEVYEMQIDVKFPNETDANNTGLYVGFLTMDKDKKIETQPPGTHRYFASANEITANTPQDLNKWRTLSGFITGSEATYTAFRPTTRYVKPFILVNNTQPNQTISLKKVKVTRLRTH